MENFPLNKAHREQRRAETQEKRGRFFDAAKSHGLAASLLDDAAQLTQSKVAKESIVLQYIYHLHQQQTLDRKALKIANQLKTAEAQDKIMKTDGGNSGGTDEGSMTGQGGSTNQNRLDLVNQMTIIEEKLNNLLDLFYTKLCKEDFVKCDSDNTNGLLENNKTLDTENTMVTCNTNNELVNIVTPDEHKEDSRVQSNDGPKEITLNYKEFKSLIVEIKSLQSQHMQFVNQVLMELNTTEKVNLQLRTQVKNLQSNLHEVEKERDKLQESSTSALSPSSTHSPCPELTPLDLPPLQFNS